MEVKSTYKYARISPFKVREVTREIQGLPVSAALDLLAFTPKKAAFLIGKTLKSAIANAENNANLKPDGLVVKEATVGEGPTLKRIMPRARQRQPDFEAHQSHSHRAFGRDRHRDAGNAKSEATSRKESGKEGCCWRNGTGCGNCAGSKVSEVEAGYEDEETVNLWDKKLIQLGSA